jgi:Asp/Glu/hydantoin racemase
MRRTTAGAINAAILREAKVALDEYGAEVIVLGCTNLSAVEIQSKLGVPVIDPGIVGFKTAELMADLFLKTQLTHSRSLAYSPAPEALVSTET